MIFGCAVCEEEMEFIQDPEIITLRRCASCGHELHVHVVPAVWDFPWSTAKGYKVFVEVPDPLLIVKTRIKVKFVFRGSENFRMYNLENQIDRGERRWDLGIYEENEMQDLLRKADGFDLNLSLVRMTWETGVGWFYD